MPKRPCAIALGPDDSTILCADKFGDVYSLPLLGSLYEVEPTSNDAESRYGKGSNGHVSKPFVPSANSRTVHTLSNQKALRNQQRINNQAAKKKSFNFDHELLFGHVSLLTDLVCVNFDANSNPFANPFTEPRGYILTSDRDEHIRVSRGIPQAHIIEGFCLGHTQFVTRICAPYWNPQLLISGGGDDYFLTWDWLTGTIRQKTELKPYVKAFKDRPDHASIMADLSPDAMIMSDGYEDDSAMPPISGIWSLDSSIIPRETAGEVVIACEG